MIKNKCKKIVSAMLLMTMSTTIFSTNVFAGGNASVVTGNQGNNDRTGQTPTTPSSFVVNGSGNNVVINQIQTQEGHLVIGKEIENKKITDIVSIPIDEIESITIKDGVTSIGEWAFDGCTGLTSITIPNSVTSIGDVAFYSCTGLTSINIPNSVTEIGEGAFQECTSLTHIIIPSSVKKIDSWAFKGCTGLTSINIPNSVTEIGEGAFKGCTGLTSITIPNSVTSIGAGAFACCTGLKEVTIPKELDITGIFNEHVKINRI